MSCTNAGNAVYFIYIKRGSVFLPPIMAKQPKGCDAKLQGLTTSVYGSQFPKGSFAFLNVLHVCACYTMGTDERKAERMINMLKKNNIKKRFTAAMLALTVVCAMLAGCTSVALPGSDDTQTPATGAVVAKAQGYTVTIDINPSIELTVVDGVVTQAEAYNDDGQVLLLSTDVQGLDPDAAGGSCDTGFDRWRIHRSYR